MELVLRALVVYLFLLVVLRLAGRRTLAQMTNFDSSFCSCERGRSGRADR